MLLLFQNPSLFNIQKETPLPEVGPESQRKDRGRFTGHKAHPEVASGVAPPAAGMPGFNPESPHWGGSENNMEDKTLFDWAGLGRRPLRDPRQ